MFEISACGKFLALCVESNQVPGYLTSIVSRPRHHSFKGSRSGTFVESIADANSIIEVKSGGVAVWWPMQV